MSGPYHALCPLLHHLVQPPCWALILIISCQAVEPVAWKQPFTPVHSKRERKGLVLPRSSSSQRKHHRLSEMRSYKNSLTPQAECSGRAENPSSVLTDAQCLVEAEATLMSPVQMAQTLRVSLWCTFFSWYRDKNSASYRHMWTNLFKRVYLDVWLSTQDQYLSLPSSYFPVLLFGKISIPSSWTVRWMQKCARAYLQLSCLKEQVRTFTSTWVFCICVGFLSAFSDRLFLTELKLVLDLALK